MIQPPFDEFRRLSREFAVVPVYREILADEETPVSAFRKLNAGPHAALLESIEGGESWGRYSMIALDPGLVFESRGRRIRLARGDAVEEREAANPLETLDELASTLRSASIPGLPRLAGGAVGFGSYDLVRRFERLPELAADDLEIPDARFVFFETAVLFDHQQHTVKVVVNARPGGAPRAAYDRALAQIEAVCAILARPGPEGAARGPAPPMKFASSVSREEYAAAVGRAQEYIRAGDVVQVVLSQRLEAELTVEPFDVYRALRVINPSPYLFFLRLGELTVLGSSPEALVRREGNRVETRPIAGTRPRGADEAEDERLRRELCASEKERAEHVMLVDLGRNDLGRVSRFGTVQTTEFLEVQRYSHVMHLVSTVRGELDDGVANAAVLAACFPAGTVSGAPKIRAMEIIEELEPVRRGLYAGAIGYLDFHGNMDMCIAIRTLLVRNGKAYVGVGAGIVADSDPEAEYAETLNKAGALLRACELAEAGLDRFSRARSRQVDRVVPRHSRPGAGGGGDG
jgi:anthranilate synthase component 1